VLTVTNHARRFPRVKVVGISDFHPVLPLAENLMGSLVEKPSSILKSALDRPQALLSITKSPAQFNHLSLKNLEHSGVPVTELW
jgi:hypothetical protein